MNSEIRRNNFTNNAEKNLLHSYDMILIMAVLKLFTGNKNAMSISEITSELNNMFSSVRESDADLFAERTLYRKMDALISGLHSPSDTGEYLRRMLLILTGGRIDYRSADGIINGSNLKGKGTQRRYFFDPLLSNSDIDLICGTVMSSRYLSDDEKNFLIARINVLESEYDADDMDLINRALFTNLPPRPSKMSRANIKGISHPSENSVLLSHIRTIYDAIQNNYRIEVIYGIYDIKEGSGRVDFHPRNSDKPYILNPYAMFWNDGEYYLVATHRDYENPAHFRIDRIIDVKIRMSEKTVNDGKTIRVPEPRNKIPPTLRPFFHRRKSESVFDSIAYTNKYPDMKIYKKENLTDCCFECTNISLQILIDNFGSNITLGKTPIEHPFEELDISGKPKKYLTATIRGVQRENAIDFAVEHSNSMTLIGPDDLVEEVRTRIREIYERYNSLFP